MKRTSLNGTLYLTEDFTVEISVDRYIKEFRNKELCLSACKACPNYAKRWGCPPFDYDTDAILSGFKTVRLFATRITPLEPSLPLDRYEEFLSPERERMEAMLLDLEKETCGRAFGYVGKCLHCGATPCARIIGEPCRHPEKVRPSLESFGFDIERTLDILFDIKLLWGQSGCMPEYLTLVCALMY